MSSVNRLLVGLMAFAIVNQSRAADYEVSTVPETKQARVSVKIDGVATKFSMPAWAPGDYQIFDYGTKVASIGFFKDGQPVEAVYDGRNTWTIQGGADTAQYLVNESRGNFSPNLRVTPTEMFVSGPGVMGWFEGHANEEQRLHLSPKEGETVGIALPKSDEPATYVARDFDSLIDSPFVVGSAVRIKEWTVFGKKHAVIAYNKPENIDLEAFAEVCEKAVRAARDLFGELPYDRYCFMFDFGGSGGGLEHKDCFRIGLGANATADRSAGIIFHEYVHAFNVKRIRSKPLGPFDYTKPAITGAIWWLEGVTDYYASVLRVRAGLTTRDEFFKEAASSYASLHRNADASKVSADESSRRVWEVRFSQGYGLSYYHKGWNVGMALDLAIRAETAGKRSLDDVIRALYQECKNGPGFEEGRIRELCVEAGGDRVGEVYDASVLQPGQIPVAESLKKMGLMMTETTIEFDPAVVEERTRFGNVWPFPVSDPH